MNLMYHSMLEKPANIMQEGWKPTLLGHIMQRTIFRRD